MNRNGPTLAKWIHILKAMLITTGLQKDAKSLAHNNSQASPGIQLSHTLALSSTANTLWSSWPGLFMALLSYRERNNTWSGGYQYGQPFLGWHFILEWGKDPGLKKKILVQTSGRVSLRPKQLSVRSRDQKEKVGINIGLFLANPHTHLALSNHV